MYVPIAPNISYVSDIVIVQYNLTYKKYWVLSKIGSLTGVSHFHFQHLEWYRHRVSAQ